MINSNIIQNVFVKHLWEIMFNETKTSIKEGKNIEEGKNIDFRINFLGYVTH